MNVEEWKSERISIRYASVDDIDRLKEICDSWSDKRLLEGEEFDEDYIEQAINHAFLPPIPEANKDHQHVMCIIDHNHTIVGFFDCYEGYPDSSCFWIGMFLIDEQYRQYSYGRDTIQFILDYCKKQRLKRCGLAVYLKNWRGLRFWIQNGFTQIESITKDKDYSDSTHALIVLHQTIN